MYVLIYVGRGGRRPRRAPREARPGHLPGGGRKHSKHRK